MRQVKVAAILVIVLVLARTAWMNMWVPFEPVMRTEGHRFVLRAEPLTEVQRDGVIAVLASMGEDFKVEEDGQIWLRRSLAEDEDLLANYTHKGLGIPSPGLQRMER